MINSIVINPSRKGVYVELKTNHDTFFVDVGNLYLEFSRTCQDTFQLIKSHSADSLNLHPVISWSGVLWTRQAALEAHHAISAYQQAISS